MKPILIIGEQCFDRYTYCDSDAIRFAPEAPVPILKILKTVETPGMAGNTARNVAALNFPYQLLTNSNWKEIVKERFVDYNTNHMFCRIDTNDKVKPIQDLDKIEWNNYSAVLISDYSKSFLTNDDIEYIVSAHPLTIVDTKRQLGFYLRNATFIKLNEHEYNAQKALGPLLESKIITTLGKRGARYQGKMYPVEEVEVKDLSGLGDVFTSSFLVKYIKTNNIEVSINYGNAAATFCVQKRGVSVIEPDELLILNEKYGE